MSEHTPEPAQTPESESDAVPTTTEQADVWHYRGYHLRPSEFATAMVHFYRGEMSRANVWRQRLDSTTNWAVVTTGATLSFAFSAPNNIHILIPINTLLITLFLIIEARRYRYYELWSYRLRLLETDLFAAMLVPPFEPRPKWATLLAESLLTPHFTISIWEAIGRRFRRNYQYIYIVLAFTWCIKIYLHPFPLQSWDAFLRRAAVGPIPGEVILAAGILFNATIFAIGWLTTGLTQASGEVLQPSDLPLPARLAHRLGELATNLIEDGAPALFQPHDQIAYIITDKGEEVAQLILNRLGRGVTALRGTGMYTGKERAILLVAVHPEQVRELKRSVYTADPNAFLILNPAHEVVGRGFQAPS
nr:DUF2270 domain-containing protein [Ardenticatena sp.]